MLSRFTLGRFYPYFIQKSFLYAKYWKMRLPLYISR